MSVFCERAIARGDELDPTRERAYVLDHTVKERSGYKVCIQMTTQKAASAVQVTHNALDADGASTERVLGAGSQCASGRPDRLLFKSIPAYCHFSAMAASFSPAVFARRIGPGIGGPFRSL